MFHEVGAGFFGVHAYLFEYCRRSMDAFVSQTRDRDWMRCPNQHVGLVVYGHANRLGIPIRQKPGNAPLVEGYAMFATRGDGIVNGAEAK